MNARSGLEQTAADREQLAAQAFVRRQLGEWTEADERTHRVQLEKDAEFADAFQRVEQSWAALGQHATAAELMALREGAISRARRANARRWTGREGRLNRMRMAAVLAAIAVGAALIYQFAPFGVRPGEYRTRIGEQRVLELEDHSRVALDAATRIKVSFSSEGRLVQLMGGQAEFSVSHDPARPFKVQAGTHTIVALGTVFTVEYVDRETRVAMVEGKVAVLPQSSAHPQPQWQRSEMVAQKDGKFAQVRRTGNGPIELIAGEALRVSQDGLATVTANADLQAATAWREGKIILHAEKLSEAVRRLNRYSRLQLHVDDPQLLSMSVSGVFDAGDTAAFAEAVQAYLPVTADYSDSDAIRLRMR